MSRRGPSAAVIVILAPISLPILGGLRPDLGTGTDR